MITKTHRYSTRNNLGHAPVAVTGPSWRPFGAGQAVSRRIGRCRASSACHLPPTTLLPQNLAQLLAAGGVDVDVPSIVAEAFVVEDSFNSILGDLARAARNWSETLSRSLGVNQYELRGILADFYNALAPGFPANEAYRMSLQLTERCIDLASFLNLPLEEVSERVVAGLSGNVSRLYKLGMLISAESLDDPESMQDKVRRRYETILARTQHAEGDLIRRLGSAANVKRRFSAQQSERIARHGTELMNAVGRTIET